MLAVCCPADAETAKLRSLEIPIPYAALLQVLSLTRRLRALPVVLVSAFLLVSLISAHSAAASRWVNCHDATREIVRKTRPGECEGHQVSDAEAATIAERRRAYIRQAIQEPAAPFGKLPKNLGSGFFVDHAGLLLTNAHVVRDCSGITVSPAWGKTLEAAMLSLDAEEDLALLDTSSKPPTIAVFAPTDQPLPPRMAVVGYPMLGIPAVRPVLSAVTPLHSGPLPPETGAIALRANLRPGNSGGPLLDPFGRVVGVVSMAVDTPRTYQQTGRIVRDIGLALTGRRALAFLERNGLKPRNGISVDPRPDLLEHAKGFVARVECWN